MRRKAAEQQQVLRTRQKFSGFRQQGLRRPPVYPLAEPKGMPSAFFFHRARRILFRQDEKEWGKQAKRRQRRKFDFPFNVLRSPFSVNTFWNTGRLGGGR